MKPFTFFLFTLLTLLGSCQKETTTADPHDAERLQGEWGNLLPTHPDWQYNFDDGILKQSVTDFGTIITSFQFPYAIRRDTLLVGGDAINEPRKYLVYLHCDSIAELRNITPGVMIAPVLWLKRKE